jgi:hypothetical protein
MDDAQISPFGGIVGRVLRDSMSVGTAVTGIVLGLVLLGLGFVLGLAGAKGLSMILGQVIVAVALARFALNGMAGESSGTIFSDAGGSWPLAMAVAGRYLVLNLLWIAPFLLLVFSLVGTATTPATVGAGGPSTTQGGPGGVVVPGSTAMTGGSSGLMLMLPILAVLTSKTFIAAAMLFIIGTTLLPPIFLIVAVRSERFGQIFSTVLWSNAFSGRLGDLYAIYVVHGGALGMLFILAIPALLLTFAAGKEIGILFLSIGMAYSGGLAITLLGRLCGFFAFGEEMGGPSLAMQPVVGPGPGTVGGRAARPRPPEIFGAPETAADLHGGMAAGDTGAPTSHNAPGSHGAPRMAGAPPSPPPVADLSQQVGEARARFESDPDGALGVLQTLREENPGHPLVLHAIALSLHQAGRGPEAVLVGREAIPVCLEHGQAALAADLFASLWKQAKELGLSHEQIDIVATVLAKAGDHSRAITAFGIALQMDSSDRKAIKGLLQLADHKMHREGRPKDAARIYTFLLQYAPDSPFAEDIRRGLADAESRLARAS